MASAAADVASIADALGIDRFAVMGDSGDGPHALADAAEYLAAATGRAALEAYLASAEFDPEVFTPAGHAIDKSGLISVIATRAGGVPVTLESGLSPGRDDCDGSPGVFA